MQFRQCVYYRYFCDDATMKLPVNFCWLPENSAAFSKGAPPSLPHWVVATEIGVSSAMAAALHGIGGALSRWLRKLTGTSPRAHLRSHRRLVQIPASSATAWVQIKAITAPTSHWIATAAAKVSLGCGHPIHGKPQT
ncbi:MAG: hypothetical protein R3C26_10280 [Calditrichia bacterium]